VSQVGEETGKIRLFQVPSKPRSNLPQQSLWEEADMSIGTVQWMAVMRSMQRGQVTPCMAESVMERIRYHQSQMHGEIGVSGKGRV